MVECESLKELFVIIRLDPSSEICRASESLLTVGQDWLDLWLIMGLAAMEHHSWWLRDVHGMLELHHGQDSMTSMTNSWA
jgi:hypothetical protein